MISVVSPMEKPEVGYVSVELNDLILALSEVISRAEMFDSHQIQFETLSTRERMTSILDKVSDGKFFKLINYFQFKKEDRSCYIFSNHGTHQRKINRCCPK